MRKNIRYEKEGGNSTGATTQTEQRGDYKGEEGKMRKRDERCEGRRGGECRRKEREGKEDRGREMDRRGSGTSCKTLHIRDL